MLHDADGNLKIAGRACSPGQNDRMGTKSGQFLIPNSLVFRRWFDAVDDQHIHRPPLRVEFQPELLLHRREE